MTSLLLYAQIKYHCYSVPSFDIITSSLSPHVCRPDARWFGSSSRRNYSHYCLAAVPACASSEWQPASSTPLPQSRCLQRRKPINSSPHPPHPYHPPAFPQSKGVFRPPQAPTYRPCCTSTWSSVVNQMTGRPLAGTPEPASSIFEVHFCTTGPFGRLTPPQNSYTNRSLGYA